MSKHKDNNAHVHTEHAFQHNIYLKKMSFPKNGTVYKGHHHKYDHITLVASGRVRVRFGAVPEAFLPAEEKEYTGVSMFATRSFRQHEITALEDNTVVCCIHAIRMADGSVLDPPSELEENQLNSLMELSVLLKGKDPMLSYAFDATSEELKPLLERAREEGTLEPGSGDKLI